MTGADFAALGAYDDSRRLEHFETVGFSQEQREGMPHPPHGLGLLGEFAIDPRTVHLEDFRDHRASVQMPAHTRTWRHSWGCRCSTAGACWGRST